MRRILPLILVSMFCVARAAEPEDDDELKPGPLQALTRFLDAAHEGDFATAQKMLSLQYLPAEEREGEGKRVSRRLMFLIDQFVTLKGSSFDKPPVGGVYEVGELPLGRLKAPVELVKRGDQWLFSARTVRAIDPAFDENGSALWDELPPWFLVRSVGLLTRFQVLGLLALLVLGPLLAFGLTRLIEPLLARLARLTTSKLDDTLVVALARPMRALLAVAFLALGTRALALSFDAQAVADDAVHSLGIAAAMWLLLVVSGVVSREILARATARNELASRAVRTQVTVLHRVANAVVLMVGGALILVQFPAVRTVGVSLLASAGVAGVVLGLAAQRSIGNLLAGIQLSFTQPMRIGDTVIVEGDWGWVEEITLTYVVVKTWDLRRLVLPISYFLEKPFQNWTRASTEILGTVYVHASLGVDVAALRAELSRILETQRGTMWNGATSVLQVTDVTESSVELRALMSSDDSSRSWDLRCLVREQLLDFLRRQGDQAAQSKAPVAPSAGFTEIAAPHAPPAPPSAVNGPAPLAALKPRTE